MTRRGRAPVVLGLCAFTHDSSAALIVDGELVGAVEEERLTGVKHTGEYPDQAVGWLLEQAGLTPADVDIVAYNFAGWRYLAGAAASLRHLAPPATRALALVRAGGFARAHRRYRRRMRFLRRTFPKAAVRGISHHRAHALYAFLSSGFPGAAVLIADSLGETDTTTIGLARLDGAVTYRLIQSIADPASLGYAYGAVTEHLGWRRGDEEGTVMALAAAGDPRRFRTLFEKAIPITDRGFALDLRWFGLRALRGGYERITPAFVEATCTPREAARAVEQVHADLAAALQERTEQVMLHLARRARDLTGAELLCLGGGVAMNCLSVGAIAASGLFENVAVPPAPGDAGTAIGAALAAFVDATSRTPAGIAGRCYLGPRFPGWNPEAAQVLGLQVCRPHDAARHLAAELAGGRIVGLFQGGVEFGPRALGNRSILASPLVPGVVERLNATIKFREPFRPFAPVVLANHASDYFSLSQRSPYMSMALPVTELARCSIPAVVHANGTARVQTVDPRENAFMAKVLEEFARRTGVPVLINTSLNVKGKPICGTPEMAIDCLRSTGLDALLLEGWWITR